MIGGSGGSGALGALTRGRLAEADRLAADLNSVRIRLRPEGTTFAALKASLDRDTGSTWLPTSIYTYLARLRAQERDGVWYPEPANPSGGGHALVAAREDGLPAVLPTSSVSIHVPSSVAEGGSAAAGERDNPLGAKMSIADRVLEDVVNNPRSNAAAVAARLGIRKEQAGAALSGLKARGVLGSDRDDHDRVVYFAVAAEEERASNRDTDEDRERIAAERVVEKADEQIAVLVTERDEYREGARVEARAADQARAELADLKEAIRAAGLSLVKAEGFPWQVSDDREPERSMAEEALRGEREALLDYLAGRGDDCTHSDIGLPGCPTCEGRWSTEIRAAVQAHRDRMDLRGTLLDTRRVRNELAAVDEALGEGPGNRVERIRELAMKAALLDMGHVGEVAKARAEKADRPSLDLAALEAEAKRRGWEHEYEHELGSWWRSPSGPEGNQLAVGTRQWWPPGAGAGAGVIESDPARRLDAALAAWAVEDAKRLGWVRDDEWGWSAPPGRASNHERCVQLWSTPCWFAPNQPNDPQGAPDEATALRRALAAWLPGAPEAPAAGKAEAEIARLRESLDAATINAEESTDLLGEARRQYDELCGALGVAAHADALEQIRILNKIREDRNRLDSERMALQRVLVGAPPPNDATPLEHVAHLLRRGGGR